MRWNFLQISQLSIRNGTHKLFRRFLDFLQFLTAISRKLWRHLSTKLRIICSAYERTIHSKKKCWKPHQNRPVNRHTILVWTMSPTRRQTKRDIQKHQFSLLQPARVVRSPQTLHADRERRDNSKSWQSFFDPTQFFLQGRKCWFLATDALSKFYTVRLRLP